MSAEIPSVVGLRKDEAINILEARGVKVRVRETRPPRARVKREPVAWRVISQRVSEEGVELVLTPEWIGWLPLRASEEMGE